MERTISKVAIYIRKSREEETEDALNRQQSVLIELCQKNNWNYELFKEVGSSQDMDRLQLQNMLDKVKLFEYDAIVVADLDRLSRSTIHFGLIKEALMSAGCQVITLSKAYDFAKQEDDLFSDLQSVLAKNEYQTIKRRLQRGVRQSAKDGNWMGKKSPVGFVYNRETKKLEKSKDATVIRRIFEHYMEGMSTKDIAYQFTFENVSTTVGMVWTPAGISRLLNNPVYKGDSLYGKTTTKNGKRAIKTSTEDQIIVENTHEGIITKEEWNLVQKLKKERNSKPIPLGANKRKYSGLIQCGLCGAIHSFQTSRYKRKRISSCQTRHYSNDNSYNICENKGMNVSEFDDLFYRLLKKYKTELSHFIDLVKEAGSKIDNSQNQSEIPYLEKQIKKLQQDIKRVQQGFIAQIFTEEQASTQIKNYNLQIEKTQQQINELSEIKDNSNVEYYERILEKVILIIEGRDTLSEKDANLLIGDIVDTIYYTRVGNKDALADISVRWKTLVNEESK